MDVRWAEQRRIAPNVILPVKRNLRECLRNEIFQLARLPCCDDEVFRLSSLEHEPHRLDILWCPTPIALDLNIAEQERFLAAICDPVCRCDDLLGYESLRS